MNIYATGLEIPKIAEQVVIGLRGGQAVTFLCSTSGRMVDLRVAVESVLDKEERGRFNRMFEECEDGLNVTFTLSELPHGPVPRC